MQNIPFPVESYTDALIYGDYLEEYDTKFATDQWRDRLRQSYDCLIGSDMRIIRVCSRRSNRLPISAAGCRRGNCFWSVSGSRQGYYRYGYRTSISSFRTGATATSFTKSSSRYAY